MMTVCICGAGTMGSGIAQVAAMAGFRVVLFDLSPSALSRAEAAVKKNIRYLVTRKKISEADEETFLSNLLYTGEIADCRGDLIIEAIIEKMQAKADLFEELAKYNGPDTLFATNTSSLSINQLQQQVSHPERFLGMHFFNPPYILKLVEVVAGNQTTKNNLEKAVDICRQMHKHAVICRDSPGFIVNRVARPYYLEALKLAEEGAASFRDIDAVLEAAGFKMGAFKLMDLIGMDVNLKVSESLYEALGRPERLKPSQLQKQMVDAGKLGKKTGEGFYTYGE